MGDKKPRWCEPQGRRDRRTKRLDACRRVPFLSMTAESSLFSSINKRRWDGRMISGKKKNVHRKLDSDFYFFVEVFGSSRFRSTSLLPSPCDLHSAIEAGTLLELVAQYPEPMPFDKCGAARWAESVFCFTNFSRPVARIDIVKAGGKPDFAGMKKCAHRRVRRIGHSIILMKGRNVPRYVG